MRTVGLKVKEKLEEVFEEKLEEVFEEKPEAAETEVAELDVKEKPKGGKK